MIKEAIQIYLGFIDEVVNVSELLIYGSLSIRENFCNTDYGSTLNSASWSLKFDEDLFFKLRDYTEKINVEIYDGFGSLLFDGVMEPVLSNEWNIPEVPSPIQCEAVDFSELLDEKIGLSMSFPAQVGGVPFWIFKRDNLSMSILYRLLEARGLADRIDPHAPDIPITIEHFSLTKLERTYREVIDALLGDFSYCITADVSTITWGKIAYYEFDNSIEELSEKDILSGNNSFGVTKRYDVHNGVVIQYPKTKVMEDALLWRGSLPTGDTENPTPGEPIAAGDYWPEESDIVETWMDFESTYLDTAYLTGKERLQNDSIALLASSDQYIQDTKDPSISLDGNPVYESLRAKLRYKNTGTEAARLYWSEVYGKALVQIAKPKAEYPEGASNPSTYPSSYIYNKSDAQATVEARYMMLSKGCWDISLASQKELKPGQVVKLRQAESRWDGYAIVISRSRSYDFSGTWSYMFVSTDEIKALDTSVTATYRSGQPRPAQDGGTPRLIYTRSAAKPATPIGANPEGWTTGMPEGTAPLWMSSCTFTSTGDQIGSWTIPVRVSGIDKGAYRGYGDSDPTDAADGDFYIYTGTTTAEREEYHFYKYSAASGSWTETQDSASVMAGWKDALYLAKQTGRVIFAAMLVLDILIANKLAVGGGTLTDGLLFRVMDDDGNGNVVIEARYNGNKVWWIDVDTGKMYGNFAEIRNVLPFQFEDSLDSTHPFEVDFYIPSDTVRIASVKLNAKGVKYRAYATSAKLWEGFRQTQEGGSHTHTLKDSLNTAVTSEVADHAHGYIKATGIGGYNSGAHSHSLLTSSFGSTGYSSTSGDYHTHSYTEVTGISGSGAHEHSLDSSSANTLASGKHSHTYAKPSEANAAGSHVHNFDMDHGHDLIFGIFEGTIPASVNLYCDNGSGYGSAISLGSNEILASELNLSSYFSGTGWKRMKFTSSRLGRIVAQLILQVDITV